MRTIYIKYSPHFIALESISFFLRFSRYSLIFPKSLFKLFKSA
ncbi:hypothetical protein BbiDN127_H0018 (plasmid) [Borreliella bissettiae DN127]|uniref:Uncharacterized protein n=1 Tax=Borrelia bissettiae (strain DSM 17990 / CIP 109136 / DN127) TaxID=521010 RepID=G0AP53_BORBD|nr:hypothetical protein BbiDN127_H0018 [Borreliella bissettiae DN127]